MVLHICTLIGHSSSKGSIGHDNTETCIILCSWLSEFHDFWVRFCEIWTFGMIVVVILFSTELWVHWIKLLTRDSSVPQRDVHLEWDLKMKTRTYWIIVWPWLLQRCLSIMLAVAYILIRCWSTGFH